MRLIVFLILASTAHAHSSDSTFLVEVTQHFTAWDANADTRLSTVEVDQVIASPGYQGKTAAVAVAIKRGGKLLRTRLLSKADIISSVRKRMEGDRTEPDYEALTAWAQMRLEKANRTLFATHPPLIDSLRQGKLGDCFCLAALRSVLQRKPTYITQMIQPRSQGAHLVHVGNRVITVPPITDGEIILGASTSNGLWPVLYEKAVGISRRQPEAQDATPFSVVTRGGSAGAMMSVLTDKAIQRWSCREWRSASEDRKTVMLAELRRLFDDASRDNRAVTGGTGNLPPSAQAPPRIMFNHGYAVLGYDAVKDEVHLWNPHGSDFYPKGRPGLSQGYHTIKGEFHVPLLELVTFFGGFAFEQP